MYLLEDRILFDGAAVADVAEAEAQVEDAQEAQDEVPEQLDAEQNANETSDSEQQESADTTGEAVAEIPDAADADPNDPLAELDAILDDILAQNNINGDTANVLIISSLIDDADVLANAAQDDVIIVRYDAETTTLNQLLEQVEDSLGGRKAESIGFAAHDYGDAKFYLTGSETISLGSTLASETQQAFWSDMTDLLAEDGRIDLLACGLASSDTGKMLVSTLESMTGADFAASTDDTGNLAAGGDWILETDDVNLEDTYFDKDKLDEYSGLMASEVQKLTASDAATGDEFGWSVSVDGDYAIVGAHYDDPSGADSGSAYIYYKDEGGVDNWGQQAKLTALDGAAGDEFGYSVSISGEYAIVGAYHDDVNYEDSGSAYIFSKDQGGADNWGQVTKLTASDGYQYDYFGCSVSIDGDIAVVGAYYSGDPNTEHYTGSAYVFYKDKGGSDNWGEQKELTPSDGVVFDSFGYSVSISGDYIIVGAIDDDDDGDGSGSAYIYYKDQGGGDNWGQQAKLTASDGAEGDAFGGSVSISGDYAIVGAAADDNANGVDAGSAYIFYKGEGGVNNWGQQAKLTAAGGQLDDLFGFSVSISGECAIVGSPSNSAGEPGAAYIYYKDQGGSDNWGELEKFAPIDVEANDSFGYDVSMSGKTVIVSSLLDDDGAADSGSAYVFDINHTSALAAIEGADINYTENDAAVAITSSLTLSDADDSKMESATVSISDNFKSGEDELLFTDTANITGSWDAATGILTLTGSDTVANYQAALRSVKYETGEDPGDLVRTVSFKVNDGDDNSNVLTRDINVTSVNDLPLVTVAGSELSYYEGNTTPIDPFLRLKDVDDANIESAVIEISSNFQVGEDVLAFAGTANIISVWDPAAGTLTLTGTDTVANYQAALRSVTFHNACEDASPARTVTFTVNDGDDNSAATRDINVIQVNDAPVGASIEAGDLAYTEGDPATVVTATLTLSDADSADLEGAVVQVSSDFQTGDVLAFVDTADITGAWDAATGTLTLTGTASVLDYQVALRTVTFASANEDPTATKAISFVVNDGESNSVAETRNIAITAVNDAPVEAAIEGVALEYNEGDATAITSTLTLSDVDDTDIEGAVVQITGNYQGAQDQLLFTNTANITGVYAGGTLTLTGTDTVANYEAALRSVQFQNSNDTPNTLVRTVSFTVNDGDDNSVAVTRDINVNAVNDAPVEANIEVADLEYTERTAAVAITSTLTLSDPDDANLESAVVTMSNCQDGADVLNFVNTANINGVWNGATGTLTLTGTDSVAAYQAALRSITYENQDNMPTLDQRTLSITVNDGDVDSNVLTRDIDFTYVNSPSVLGGVEVGDLAYTEDNSTSVSSTITLTDIDDNNMETATIQISGNYENGQDFLVFADTANISSSWNAANGTLTLTGTDTKANYEAALRAVKFETGDNPNVALQRTVTFTVDDGDDNSNSVSRNIDITAVNDAPTATVEGSTVDWVVDLDAATPVSPSFTVIDPDDSDLESATIQISGNYQVDLDTLTFEDTANISGAWDKATGTMTLVGTDSVANYQAALRTVIYANESAAQHLSSRAITITLNDGDADSAAVARSVRFLTPDAPEAQELGLALGIFDDGTDSNGIPDTSPDAGFGEVIYGDFGGVSLGYGVTIDAPLSNGDYSFNASLPLPNGENSFSNGVGGFQSALRNGGTGFNLPNGEHMLEYSFTPVDDEGWFVDASGDADYSQFSDLDESFDKHPLFKTDYEKIIDELVAI